MALNDTKVLPVDPVNPEDSVILQAAHLLVRGELVAFPTETVYGLGGDALDARTPQRIYEAKNRPADNPLIVHIAHWKQLEQLTPEIPDTAYPLIRNFWPGPLTMVFKRAENVPLSTTGGQQTVAVRMPDHPVALALLRKAGIPVAAPSANLSGRPSPTTAEHVIDDLNGRIAAVLDGGPTRIGLESTVLDLSAAIPVILRPGGITIDMINAVVPYAISAAPGEAERSPGTRYRHYAPRAKVIVVESLEHSIEEARLLINRGHRVGWIGQNSPPHALHLMFPNDAAFYARFYYAALRDIDHQGVEVVFVEPVREEGVGVAVMDRVKRSAGYDKPESSS